MKVPFIVKGKMRLLLAALSISLLLGIVSGCSSYNPYTGRYEPDPGKTMMAVGGAAFAGSVVHHHNYHHHNYYRPPYHHHYHY